MLPAWVKRFRGSGTTDCQIFCETDKLSARPDRVANSAFSLNRALMRRMPGTSQKGDLHEYHLCFKQYGQAQNAEYVAGCVAGGFDCRAIDRKSTRLNSSH